MDGQVTYRPLPIVTEPSQSTLECNKELPLVSKGKVLGEVWLYLLGWISRCLLHNSRAGLR